MAVEPREAGHTKPLIQLFPKAAECVYTSCYCEENVWKLCQDVATRHGSELQHCCVAFVSNPWRSVPLWRQRAGKDEDKLVIWDYHVILIYAPDERAVVYDLDSALPFPTHFWKYAMETYRSDDVVQPEHHRRFRVVPASVFLREFASDRHHMKREDGTWIKTPPDYPPISTPMPQLASSVGLGGATAQVGVASPLQTGPELHGAICAHAWTPLGSISGATCKNNLDSFINTDPGTGLGIVLTLEQFFDRYHRPIAIGTAPRAPPPQAKPT